MMKVNMRIDGGSVLDFFLVGIGEGSFSVGRKWMSKLITTNFSLLTLFFQFLGLAGVTFTYIWLSRKSCQFFFDDGQPNIARAFLPL